MRRQWDRGGVWRGAGLLVAAVLSATDVVALEDSAPPSAWVAGRLRVFVRRGPTEEYKVTGSVLDGDPIAVIEQRDGWAQIQVEGGLSGWMDASYVSEEPPPAVRAGQLEAEVSNLRERLERADKETSRLLDESLTLTARDAEQRDQIATLAGEGMALRSHARWREWLTGASILGLGMLGGAILYRTTTRRRSSRIRL